VSGALALIEGGREDWRAELAAAIRPQFRVDLYVAGPGDRWLYGQPCAVAGCSAPRFRPLNGGWQ